MKFSNVNLGFSALEGPGGTDEGFDEPTTVGRNEVAPARSSTSASLPRRPLSSRRLPGRAVPGHALPEPILCGRALCGRTLCERALSERTALVRLPPSRGAPGRGRGSGAPSERSPMPAGIELTGRRDPPRCRLGGAAHGRDQVLVHLPAHGERPAAEQILEPTFQESAGNDQRPSHARTRRAR